MVPKLVLPLHRKMDKNIIYNFEDVKIPDFNPEFFSLWLKEVIKQYDREVGEIAYVFCSDDYLLDVNKEYLDHDYYTDIITFNYNEGSSLNGDLFISYDRVLDNAIQLEIDRFDELCRVMVHGVLHLIGFNDKTEEEEVEMRRIEDECLMLRKSFT